MASTRMRPPLVNTGLVVGGLRRPVSPVGAPATRKKCAVPTSTRCALSDPARVSVAAGAGRPAPLTPDRSARRRTAGGGAEPPRPLPRRRRPPQWCVTFYDLLLKRGYELAFYTRTEEGRRELVCRHYGGRAPGLLPAEPPRALKCHGVRSGSSSRRTGARRCSARAGSSRCPLCRCSRSSLNRWHP